jgi:hypothetical protein
VNPSVLGGFSDELQKIAAGPYVMEEPTFGTARNGTWAKLVKRRDIDANPAARKEIGALGVKPGRDIMVTAPDANIKAHFGEHAPAAKKALRRHEMTHWMRGQRGKMKRYGQPGLRGVATTLREEVAAHISSLKGQAPAQQQQLAQGVIPGTMQSSRTAYGGSLRRGAASGGNTGRVLRALRLVR